MPTLPPPTIGGLQPGAPQQPPMRDRIARAKTLVRRGFTYWKMSSFLFIVAAGVAMFVAMNVKRVYKSEVTIIAKPGLRTDDKDESAAQRTAKLTGDLKDALTTESHLEAAIQQFKLYPRTVDAKGLKDAADEMAPHVGFRAKAESGRYVISFDSSEVSGPPGTTQDLVKDVTEFLAKTLIDDYASGDLKAKKDQLAFDEAQEKTSNERLEKATKEFATFLLAHPEFALDAKNASSGAASPLGVPSPIGISSAAVKQQTPAQQVQPRDPALAALYANDGQLGALWRQRQRLQAEIQANNAAATPAPTATTTAPAQATAAQLQALDDQINAANDAVQAAAQNAAAAQADLASKQATLGPENPDLKTAQNNAAGAAAALRSAKSKLASLQAQKAALSAAPTPATTAPAAVPDNPQNAELAAKLKDIDGQIAYRESELKKQLASNGSAAGTTPPAASSSASAATPPPGEPVNPIVQLETEYLRLFRELTTAKSTNERAKLNHEKSQLAVEAAQAASNDVIAIETHSYRPTSPSKGGRTPAAAAGLFVAIMLALLYAAARVVFNDTLIDAQDVEALQLIPVLGTIPKIHVTAQASQQQGGISAGGPSTANRGAPGAV